MKTLTDKQYKELREEVERLRDEEGVFTSTLANGMERVLDKLDTFK